MTTFTKQITVDNDDGYDFNGTFNASTGLFSGNVSFNALTAGVRFASTTVPQGATVSSATLTLVSSGADTGTPGTCTVFGVNSDSCVAFTTTLPSAQPQTAGSANAPHGGTLGTTYNIDVTAIVQAILNRAGWASGNAMGFVIVNTGTSGINHADWQDVTNNPAQAATLSVTYSSGTTTNQSCLASTNAVGRLIRSTAKPLTRTTSAVGRLIRSTAKPLTRTTSAVGRLIRSTAKPLTRTTSAVASETAGRINARSLLGSTSPAGSLVRSVAKSLAGSTSPAGSLVRSTARTLAASTSPVASLVRSAASALLGSSSPVASLIRSTAKVLTRTTSPAGSLVRSAAKALAVSSSPVGTVVRLVAKILRASTSPVASLVIPHAATWYTLKVGDYLVVSGKASAGDKVAFLTSASLSPVLIPADWDNAHNHVHCTGAGGKGSAAVGSGNSSVGGRGGCYARKDNVTAIANAGTAFSMGDGTTTTGVDTWFDAPTTVLAKGATITNTGSVGDFVSHGGDRDTGAGGGAGGPDGNGTAGVELTLGGDADNGGDASGGLNASQAGVSGQYWDDGSLTGSIVGFGAGNAATGGVAFLGGNYGGGGSGIEFNLSIGTTPGGDGGGGLITLIYTPVPGTTYFQSCLGATAPIARLARSTAKLLRAGTIAVALLVRSIARVLTVTSAPIASLTRTVSTLRQATTSPAASLQRGLARTLTVATSAVASLVRMVAPGALRVTTAPVPRLVRSTGKPLTVTTAPVAALVRSIARALMVATAPGASLIRSTVKSLAVATAPIATLRRGLVKALQAATVPIASDVLTIDKPLAVMTAPVPSLGRGYSLVRLVSTAPVASLGRVFGKFLQAITAPLATLLLRVFQMPPACRIIYVKARNLVVTVAARNNVAIVPARKNIIVIDSCTACPAVFPARYVGESDIYGFDFTARLREGESIASETVVLTEGDMIVSNVGALAGLVAFRLSGGSPAYQRLVCTITTDSTPANVYEAEATITCLP